MRNRGLPGCFFDLAMGALFGLLAVVAVSTVKPSKADGITTPKAEFEVELTWPDNSPTDYDLYVKSPDGQIVFFKNKTTALMGLDRDNTGISSNTVEMPDGGTKVMPDRTEIITIRGIVAGTFQVNVHAYRRDTGMPPEDVRVRVIKINPYSVVFDDTKSFDAMGEEKTYVNFTVTDSGAVSEVFVSPSKMVGTQP